MRGEQLVFHANDAVDRIDPRALEPGGVELCGLGEKRPEIARCPDRRHPHGALVPAFPRRAGSAKAGRPRERRIDLPLLEEIDQTYTTGGDDVRGRLILRHVLLVVRDPRDAPRIDAVFALQDAAHPNTGRHGVSANADALTHEVLRLADPGVDPDLHVAEVEHM